MGDTGDIEQIGGGIDEGVVNMLFECVARKEKL
jgi:hypothetical protein